MYLQHSFQGQRNVFEYKHVKLLGCPLRSKQPATERLAAGKCETLEWMLLNGCSGSHLIIALKLTALYLSLETRRLLRLTPSDRLAIRVGLHRRLVAAKTV